MWAFKRSSNTGQVWQLIRSVSFSLVSFVSIIFDICRWIPLPLNSYCLICICFITCRLLLKLSTPTPNPVLFYLSLFYHRSLSTNAAYYVRVFNLSKVYLLKLRIVLRVLFSDRSLSSNTAYNVRVFVFITASYKAPVKYSKCFRLGTMFILVCTYVCKSRVIVFFFISSVYILVLCVRWFSKVTWRVRTISHISSYTR